MTFSETMIGKLWRIALSAGFGYFDNRLATSAAAMAFYTMFALGPIMIFTSTRFFLPPSNSP